MWILLQTSAAGRFSEQFRETTGDILTWGLIILGIILLITVPFVLRNIINKKREKKERIEQIDKIKTRRKIDPELEDVIKLLADQNPRKDAVLQVLTDSGYFKSCERRLFNKLEPEEFPMENVNRLRFALGFVPEIEGRQLYNTAEIDPKREMKINPEGFSAFPAVITANTPYGFSVKRMDGNFLPGVGNPVSIEIMRDEGIYRFDTVIISIESGTILLEHREIKGFAQQRKYFRKELNREVNVRLGGTSGSYTKTRLIDLSGGGCSIENPDGAFKKGDDVEVYIETEEPIKVIGEVIRTSGNRKILHLSFPIIRDTVRDRIIGFLLQN
jgi:hypothetical protein